MHEQLPDEEAGLTGEPQPAEEQPPAESLIVEVRAEDPLPVVVLPVAAVAEPADEPELEDMLAEMADTLPEAAPLAAPATAAEPERALVEAIEPAPAAEAEPEPGIAIAAEPEPDAAPEPAAEPDAAPRRRLARLPLALYVGAWVVLAGVSVWLLQGRGYPPAAKEYEWLVLAACALAGLAPVVWAVAWLLSRRISPVSQGLASSAMLWTAVTVFLGMALWWGALVLVDALRLGWIG